MAEPTSGLIRDIEVLRAVAVLGVILQHINGNFFPKTQTGDLLSIFFTGGWVGVDLFFAISGFVIARSFLPGALDSASKVDFRVLAYRFWLRRLFRLAPSAWLWLLIILALCVGYNQSEVFGSLQTNLYWTLSGVLNFSNYLFIQYFGVAKPGVSFVYWSLSLEEQFYLCFPLVVWVFKRHLAAFLIVLVIVQFFSQRGLYGMMFRTDAIALGVLIAILVGNHSLNLLRSVCSGWHGRLMVFSLLGLLFWLGTFSQSELPYQIGLVAVVSALLVWFCSGQQDVLAGRGLISVVLLWLGKRSYAMYLIHIPAMFFLRETAFRLQLDITEHVIASSVLLFFLTAALADINYRWVEMPLRLRGNVLAARLFGERRTAD
jgi:peptidoglycan/LPS O-acetylase OafA/YrhL